MSESQFRELSQLQELYARHDPATEPSLRPGLLDSCLADGRRRAGRRLALRAATSGVAAVVTLAVVGGVIAGASTGSPPGGGTDEPRMNSAGAVLSRTSLAAASKEPLKVRDDQFVYTRYTMEADPPSSSRARNVVGTGESWVSVDGSRPGWHIGPDKLGETRSDPTAAITGPGFDAPTYRFLSTLPTDPDALLDGVRAHVESKEDLKPNAVADPDQEAFEVLGRLNSSLMPPRLRAAVYRAAAKIPGVTVAADVVDAAGRHGIGVTRESTVYGRSMTWIFDEETYRYLGHRTVSTRTGRVTGSLAVLNRAVVDEVRQVP